MDTNTLAHYGVKGMHWGIRRTPEQLSRASGRKTSVSGKQKRGKAEAEQSSSPKKKLSELSDDELREKINRLELEKRYNDLSKATSEKKTSRGKAFCVDVLETIGKNTLTNIGTQAANHILGDAINKIAGVDSNDAANRIVNPQKGQSDKK